MFCAIPRRAAPTHSDDRPNLALTRWNRLAEPRSPLLAGDWLLGFFQIRRKTGIGTFLRRRWILRSKPWTCESSLYLTSHRDHFYSSFCGKSCHAVSHTHQTVGVIAVSISAIYGAVRSVVVSVCSLVQQRFGRALSENMPLWSTKTRPLTFACSQAGALSSQLLLPNTVKLRTFPLAGAPRLPTKGVNAHSKLH